LWPCDGHSHHRKPAPGTAISYSTSLGQTGSVTVDPYGHVTVPAVRLAPGSGVVLTLTQ
jgi:hypothetical protein